MISTRSDGGKMALNGGIGWSNVAPDRDGAIAPQGHAVMPARGDGGHIREPSWNDGLAVLNAKMGPGIIRSRAPGDYGAIGFERECVVAASGDCRDVGQS